MIKIPSFKQHHIERTSYAQLVEELKQIEGYNSERLEDSVEGREIYGFMLGDMNKPTIHIHGQIHGGHEWRTSHWVKLFMKLLVNPNEYPELKNTVNNLKRKFSFYFIPCVNPDGYHHRRYANANGVSISRNFDFMWEETEVREGQATYKGSAPFSEPESRNIRDVVLRIKPISFVCTHSWGGYTGIMMRNSHNSEVDVMVEDYFYSNILTSGISYETDSSYTRLLLVPSAYNWAGEQVSSIGRPIFSHVLETGTLETDAEQTRLGLNGLLLHCIYVDKWYSRNSLIIDES